MKRRTFLTAMLGVPVLGAAAFWRSGRDLRPYTAADVVFGTTVSMTVMHGSEAAARAALAAAFTSLREIDALMSIYRPNSEVGRLNRYGRLNHPDPRLLKVLRVAEQLSQRTNGAFDVTVQPLWQAANARQDRGPALSHVGWRKLQVSERELRFDQPGMAITLNGIAQGYAADQALTTLERFGICQALIDSGELASLGERDEGRPWMLGVRDPRDETAFVQTWAADGRCLASSGDYATHFTEDFSQHHIIDPHSGNSPTELAAVSVLAPEGILADGLSTACMVMGSEKSLALAAAWPEVDVMCIAKTGAVYRSKGFPLPALHSQS